MRSCLAFLICLGTVAPSVYADHFAGGTISTRCVGNNFHEVTLQLFIDCSGADLLPQQLAFSNSCGVVFTLNGLQPVDVVEVSSLCPSEIENSTCNGGSLPGYRLLTYRTTTYLSPCAKWVISWMTCCRQQSLNLLGGPGIYVETVLNNLGGTCNEAPSFVNNRIPLVCLGQAVTHDIHAIEGDGNALRYEFIDARFGNPGPLPLQYASGYTGTEPFTGMTIDPITGLMAIALAPQEAELYVHRGNLLLRKKDYGAAVDDFSHVVSLQPQSVPALLNRAVANFHRRRPKDVIADATAVIEIRKDIPDAYLLRALGNIMTGEPARARRDYDAAVEAGLTKQAIDTWRPVFYREG